MINDLKPYPEYKDSGVAWLGKVPEHWAIRRIKTLLCEVDRRSFTGTEPLLSMTRQRGLIRQVDATNKMHSAATLIGYKVCHPGEIVMNRMQAWSGMFHVAPEYGLVSPDYAVFALFDDTNPDFLGHLLRSPDIVAKFYSESKGIGSGFLRFYSDRFCAVYTSIPPLLEQMAIVRFLDYADQRIRRYIRAKQKLIKLLEEQKQAIINRAVTRGLDPNVRLKPSGIEWLGDIPEHWEVCRLRNVVSGVTSGSRGWSSYAADSGPLFIRIANLRRASLDLRFEDVVRLSLPDTSETERTRVRPHDLLVLK